LKCLKLLAAVKTFETSCTVSKLVRMPCNLCRFLRHPLDLQGISL
jgi:hypothetical protein